jgi:hypothetical protein
MSSRLRSLDSKITFFAFADIITAVSGVLIFVALLLATDLGRPTDSRTQSANSEMERQLQDTLAQQAAVEAENHRLQTLLAAAAAAPDLNQLQADLARLRAQLAQEQKKQTALTDQMTDSQAAIAARDRALGLTDLDRQVQRTVQTAAATAQAETRTRREMDNLAQQAAHVESQLLRLRQREGQLWLIPDQNMTTKEPIVVTVSGTSATIERFDHPDDRRQMDESAADAAFRSYLSHAQAHDQYVLFLVRPSGIELFKGLLQTARSLGFEVGYDAVDENRRIHFSPPPPIEDATPAAEAAANPATPAAPPSAAATNASPAPARPAGPTAASSPTNPAPRVPAPGVAAPVKHPGWWQRLLEWIGLE